MQGRGVSPNMWSVLKLTIDFVFDLGQFPAT